jgi:hypothetical protein
MSMELRATLERVRRRPHTGQVSIADTSAIEGLSSACAQNTLIENIPSYNSIYKNSTRSKTFYRRACLGIVSAGL